MPPPLSAALPLKVEARTESVPLWLKMPPPRPWPGVPLRPPAPPWATFALSVLLTTVTLPAWLNTAPPRPASAAAGPAAGEPAGRARRGRVVGAAGAAATATPEATRAPGRQPAGGLAAIPARATAAGAARAAAVRRAAVEAHGQAVRERDVLEPQAAGDSDQEQTQPRDGAAARDRERRGGGAADRDVAADSQRRRAEAAVAPERQAYRSPGERRVEHDRVGAAAQVAQVGGGVGVGRGDHLAQGHEAVARSGVVGHRQRRDQAKGSARQSAHLALLASGHGFGRAGPVGDTCPPSRRSVRPTLVTPSREIPPL